VNPESVIVNDTVNAVSSDPLAKLLAAADSQDASHSKCNAAGFLKQFLAQASPPECKELSIEDGVKIMYLLEQCSTSEVELDQEELDGMAEGMLNIMKDPTGTTMLPQSFFTRPEIFRRRLPKSESQSWLMPDTGPACRCCGKMPTLCACCLHQSYT
jgi:hypothetical protein